MFFPKKNFSTLERNSGLVTLKDFSKLCMSMQKETLAGENREKYYKKVLNNIQNNIHLSMRIDSGESIENVICQE